MIRFIALLLIASVLFPGPALAHTPPMNVPEAAMDVPEAAQPAAATVDRFFAALTSGDLDKAAAELDPGVIILESGGAERSAAEYLGDHAKADAEFLKTAEHRLVRRIARVRGELAWIASESELGVQQDGKATTILSVETMVLQFTAAGWKIVHAHWSSRVKKPGQEH